MATTSRKKVNQFAVDVVNGIKGIVRQAQFKQSLERTDPASRRKKTGPKQQTDVIDALRRRQGIRKRKKGAK